jgi:hypothetical protein
VPQVNAHRQGGEISRTMPPRWGWSGRDGGCPG